MILGAITPRVTPADLGRSAGTTSQGARMYIGLGTLLQIVVIVLLLRRA
jgi:hypothetical protein